MKKIQINTTFTAYDSIDSLDDQTKGLMLKAVEVRKQAYAPYSKFRVGAAILLENGKVVIGNNQESAAYPSGLCAERVAIFQAGSLYPDTKILKIAISATSDIHPTQRPTPPCGACRQSISEYEQKQDIPIELYFMGETGEVFKSDSLENLLPLSFHKDFL
ncbi:MAG TPA: cytidine deaminase [Flavobacterium sp.]|nr:cytidine deaminase [Flavobacterium sp.]